MTKASQKDILTGSFNVLVEFLIRLMKKMSPPISISAIERNSNKDKPEDKKARSLISEKELNIDKLNPTKPADSATTLVEFVILTACQTLSLPPKQVLALLGDGCNYFAHLLVKGVKGSYVELLDCLNKFDLLSEKFVHLIQQNIEKNFEFTLQMLKPGLLSKS
jgi:hypothetical protein